MLFLNIGLRLQAVTHVWFSVRGVGSALIIIPILMILLPRLDGLLSDVMRSGQTPDLQKDYDAL